jgi:hypothetical protein
MMLAADPSSARSFAETQRAKVQAVQAAQAKLDSLFEQAEKGAKGTAASVKSEVCSP